MQEIDKLKSAIDGWDRLCSHHLLYHSKAQPCENPFGCILNYVESRGVWHCGIDRAEQDGHSDDSMVAVLDPRDQGLIAKTAAAAIDHNLSTAVEMLRTEHATLFASPSSRLQIGNTEVALIRSTRMEHPSPDREFIFAVRANGQYQEIEVDQQLGSDAAVVVHSIRHITWLPRCARLEAGSTNASCS